MKGNQQLESMQSLAKRASLALQDAHERQLEFSYVAFAKAKSRADELTEVLDNHLEPEESLLPLPPESQAIFTAVSGHYWKLLKHNNESRKAQAEYGMDINQLAVHIRSPVHVLQKRISTKEIPSPKSIFNGERKFNLLQVAAIVHGRGAYLAAGDQTKAWYAAMHAEAMDNLRRRAASLTRTLPPIDATPSPEVAPPEPPAAAAPAPQAPAASQLAKGEPATTAAKPKSAAAAMRTPTRRKGSDYRDREHLTEDEIERLMAAAQTVGRHGHRDSTLILITYRHGLSVTELIGLRWTQVDFEHRLLFLTRLRSDAAVPHPLSPSEIKALTRLRREYPEAQAIFCSERDATPLTSDAIRKIVGRAGQEAKLDVSVHPHMLRHSCGFKLAQDGRNAKEIKGYLGILHIEHVARYFPEPESVQQSYWAN